MAYDLNDKLVIGISSRALFDLEQANAIYQNEGVAAYAAFQRRHDDASLAAGTAFPPAGQSLATAGADGAHRTDGAKDTP